MRPPLCHLRSAIYVVDLKKFRQIAAGDRLRGQYQGLSQDPNSLANLDQDLPNNMIHQVCVGNLAIAVCPSVFFFHRTVKF